MITTKIRVKRGGKVGRNGKLRLSMDALKKGIDAPVIEEKPEFELPEIFEAFFDTETDSTLRGWGSLLPESRSADATEGGDR